MSDINYSTITAAGSDAFEFLQAQLTVDLNDLVHEQAPTPLRSAWCNPKGRVICIVSISGGGQTFDLSLPADLAETVVQKMTLFRFRSKVEFSIRPGRPSNELSDHDRLLAGIPEITRAESEKFTAHMLNLDLLHIVSLDKGCYPGQEIVARTHYRGSSKRRCLRFASSEPLAAGAMISDGNREIGEVVNVVDQDLLAVVPLAAADQALTCGGAELTLQPLPYAIA